MSILICTIGQNWQIAAESLGFINRKDFDLYRNHPSFDSIEATRSKYFIEEADEIWLLSTDSEKQKMVYDSFNEWINLTCMKTLVYFFTVPGKSDITDEASVKEYAELCYRKMFEARVSAGTAGKVYVSIAAGRKTMSSDLLDAAHIFGADAVIHVIDDGNPPPNSSPESLVSAPDEYIKHFHPLVTGKYLSQDFVNDLLTKEVNGNLYEYIQNELEKAANHYRNFDTADDNFRILYQYKKSVIDRLKETKIGVDPSRCEEELRLLRGLPKTDLHCHLGGVLDPDDLSDLGRRFRDKQNWIPDDKKKKSLVESLFNKNLSAPELRSKIFGKYASEKDYCSIRIKKYEKLGDIQGSSLLQSEAIIRFAVRKVIEKSHAHNISHLEIRCSPINYTRGGLTGRQVLEAICKEIELFKEGISVSLLIIASRHGNMSSIYQHIELVEQMKNDELFKKYFKGFDLAGDESKRKPAELRNAFLPVMENYYNITIHAGETVVAQNIWEAVYHLNAERIGHGLTLKNDPSLMTKILDRNIGIEMCPSSNFQIVGFRDNYYPDSNSFEVYPLKEYLDKGLRVSVNTDNPGISLTNATNELLKAARLTPGGLSLWDILKLIKNGFKTAFVGFSERQRLIQSAERDIEKWIKDEIL